MRTFSPFGPAATAAVTVALAFALSGCALGDTTEAGIRINPSSCVTLVPSVPLDVGDVQVTVDKAGTTVTMTGKMAGYNLAYVVFADGTKSLVTFDDKVIKRRYNQPVTEVCDWERK